MVGDLRCMCCKGFNSVCVVRLNLKSSVKVFILVCALLVRVSCRRIIITVVCTRGIWCSIYRKVRYKCTNLP